MNAPALHPTARMRPVLLERLERQRWAHCWAALLLAGLAVYLRVKGVEITYSAAVAGVLACGGCLSSLQTIGSRQQPVWDAALPVDPARHAWVRLLCGVAGAASLLVVMVGLYAALFGDPGHPGWYPLALIAWGLTAHLLVSSLLLTAGVPIGLLVFLMLCPLVFALLPLSLEEPEELGRMGMTVVLARTALLLGLAGAVAYLAARFPGRAPEQYARTPRWNSAAARASRPAPLPPRLAPFPSRPAQPLVPRAGLARPSATLAVFRRHFALMCRFTIVPALTLIFVALSVLAPLSDWADQAGEVWTAHSFLEATLLPGWCAWIALSWAVLVWTAERGARRKWNDTLPIGTTQRRMLHVAAGAAWLLLFIPFVVAAPLGGAAAAGILDSPSDVPAWLWLGLPIRTLTLYLAVTFVLFGIRMAFNAFPLVALFLVSPGIGLVERLVSAAARNGETPGWGYVAAALWLVLVAAAAAGAIALGDWVRRLNRLPTLGEVRGFLHEWAGTLPDSSFHGHAGR